MELVSITNVDSQNEITKQLNKIKSDKKIVDDNSQVFYKWHFFG